MQVPCTPRAMASSGQLRRGQNCCRFYLITLMAGPGLAGHSTQRHSVLAWCRVAMSGLPGGASFTPNPSCAMVKSNNKTCRTCVLHPMSSKPILYLAYMLVGGCICLLLLPVSLSSGMQRASLLLHGNHML